MPPSSLSFTIHYYLDFPKSWRQKQKVAIKEAKFGVNENSANYLGPAKIQINQGINLVHSGSLL